jgi:hypothetical protein
MAGWNYSDVQAAQGKYLLTAVDPRLGPGLDYALGTVVVFAPAPGFSLMLQKQSEQGTNPTAWSVINNGGGPTPPVIEPLYSRYIDPDQGNDVTGNGSLEEPYKTIARGILDAVDPSRNYNMLLAAGQYPEPQVVMKANINITGLVANNTGINNGLIYTALPGENPVMFISQVALQGGFTMDLSAAVGGVISMFSGLYGVNRLDSNPAPFLIISGGIGDSIYRGKVIVNTGLFFSPIEIKPGSTVVLNNCYMLGAPVTIEGDAVLTTLTTTPLAGPYLTGVIDSGNTPTWNTDAASDTSFAGAVNKNVYGVTASYNPAVPGNWPVIPADIQEALDELATLGVPLSLDVVGAVPNAEGASLAGQVLSLQPASDLFPGVVTTGTQTFAGVKTLLNDLNTSSVIPTADLAFTIGVGGLAYAAGLINTMYINQIRSTFPGDQGVIEVNGRILRDSGETSILEWGTGIKLPQLAAGAAILDNSGNLSSSAGIVGEVLTSNGPGVSPTFQASSSAPITTTDKYYVDGTVGNDLIATGNLDKPFKTIQACLNMIGQPITKSDAMRHIEIHISDSLTSLPTNAPATFDGVYEENLTVPSRMITMYGAGVKVGNNGASVGFGNILKEYSSSRRFGATSSELRPCLTLVGVANARDTHSRLRNSFHVGGNCRTSILQRNLDSIQGNGVNTVTIHVAPGQFPYPITIPSTFPAEPLIRIAVRGTTNYNATYDITSQIDATTFIGTRITGTNASVALEVAGSFFESDSAGASGVTHDAAFINTYMQGAYTCDDGTVNGAAVTAGTEVLFSNGVRYFTGIEGRTILCQRWESVTLTTAILSSIAGMNNCSIDGNMTVSTFTYGADDMGFMNIRFGASITFTVSSAGQTVRMDGVTLTSFLNTGSSWVTNTPTISYLDQSKAVGYTPSTPANWAGSPATTQTALDRLGTAVAGLLGGPIP